MAKILSIIAIACYLVCLSEQKDLLPVDQFKERFSTLKNDIWQTLEKDEISNDKLIAQFEAFGDELFEEFPHDITHGLNMLESSWVWARAYSELRTIHALYEAFRRFQVQQTTKNRVPSPKQAWLDIAETILHDSKSSIPSTNEKLLDIIENKKLFNEVLKEVQTDMICNIKESPHQIITNLYNTVELTQLKAHMMIQFAHMLYKYYKKEGEDNTDEIKRVEEQYMNSSNKVLENAINTLKRAPRELWKCDPPRYLPGENYVEITELLQGYIQNEVDLNPEGTCMENCNYYSYTKSHSCYKNLYCQQQRRCRGKIHDCQFLDSDAWVCPSELPNRRYQYVEYENGRILGRKQECRAKTKVDSWWRWLFWHCSYCMCICDEPGINSDRYFNMRASKSDIKNNRVVTGLRFKKVNRIIHMQIQEGTLLPYGKIDSKTVKWVEPENYKITDMNIFDGQDFHTLSWSSRALDLDDLTAPAAELLTGLRFKMIGNHLNLEIYCTPFDYATGKLQGEKSYWKDNPTTDIQSSKPRRKLDLEKRNIPTHTTQKSVPDTKHNQYLEFTHSSLEADIAQTTLPFIDIQPVEPSTPLPLAGAGIYHKGFSNFGGFIGLKTISMDYTQLLKNAIAK